MHPLLELLEGLLPVRLAARLGKLGIGEPSILRVEGLFFFGDVLRARRCRRVSNSSSDMICSHSQFNARRGLLYKSICLISCCKYF